MRVVDHVLYHMKLINGILNTRQIILNQDRFKFFQFLKDISSTVASIRKMSISLTECVMSAIVIKAEINPNEIGLEKYTSKFLTNCVNTKSKNIFSE